jgi:N-glycosylase/DNA lyase
MRLAAETEHGGIWSAAAGGRYVEVMQNGSHFLFSCEEDEFEGGWRTYFDMDTDYEAVKCSVDPEDEYLQAAMAFGGGVRILRQDLWEMIVTFLISQNNNIPRIRNSVDALCAKFGERKTGIGLVLEPDGCVKPVEKTYDSFPEAGAVAAGGLEGLAGLGLGYRDKYIWTMAEKCSGPDGAKWLDDLRAADYHTAHGMLTAEFGIGRSRLCLLIRASPRGGISGGHSCKTDCEHLLSRRFSARTVSGIRGDSAAVHVLL